MSNFKLDYPHVIFYFGDTLCAKQLNNSSWGEQWSRGSFCSYRNVLIPFLHLKKISKTPKIRGNSALSSPRKTA